ncbi:MAG: hypothetical protein QXF52_08370 [Thermoproteota archaeon]
MMSKPLKVMLLALLLSLSISVIYASLMSVIAQTGTSQKDFRYGKPSRGPLGFFRRGWSQNFNKSTQINPYCGRFRRGLGSIEVSEEFKENVVNIAESDQDVQKLLSEGYNITCIKPIISTIIEEDGSVVTKAKSAVLSLHKNTSGIASVWVDVEKGKVTRIEIITRTIIEKP